MLQRGDVEPLLRGIPRLTDRLDELLACFNDNSHSTHGRDFLLWLESQEYLTRVELAQLLDADEITVTHYRPKRRDTPQNNAAPGPALSVADSERYVLVGHAGRGGMATVHIARDTELMRRVAYKSLLATEASSSPADRSPQERFIREVQITAQLDHPHIVPVYSLEVQANGTPAYTMKLVEGRTFSAYLDDARAFYLQRTPPDEAHDLPARLERFLKVCDAMHYAHTKGIVHRDLKPANIMIGRHNEVYVMDWGICRLLSEAETAADASGVAPAAADPILARLSADAAQTQEGSLLGTPRYMSPEQAGGRLGAVGPASDQCSLGLILFEVVTLQAPFDGTTTVEVLKNAIRGNVRPVVHAYARQAIPRELIAIIHKATAVAPEARYLSVSALADDLRRYLRGAAVMARPDSPWQAASRWVARHRQATLAVASSLIVIALAITAEWLTLRHEHRIVEQAALRERGLNAVMSAVTLRREQLAAVLLRTEAGVQRLAATAEQALLFGTPGEEPYYTVADLRERERAPGDLSATPVWSFPADMERSSVAARILRIARLRDHRDELFSELSALLSASGNPSSTLAGIQLVLADGLTSTYPATTLIPAHFDARRSPWYTLDRDSGTHWHAPHTSAWHANRLLTVTSTLHDQDERGIGVAALSLSADTLAETFLRPAGIPNAVHLLLIDARGNIILDSDPEQPPGPAMLEDPALIQAMGRDHAGYRPTLRHARAHLAVYSRLQIADWSLLALIDDSRLIAVPEG